MRSVVRVQCMCPLIDPAFEGSSYFPLQALLNGVTFCHAPSNEALQSCSDPGGMAERLSVCERLLSGGGLALPSQEVVVVENVIVPFGVDQTVLYYWHCLWTSGGQNFLENGGTGCGCVMAPPLQSSILNAHFRLTPL